MGNCLQRTTRYFRGWSCCHIVEGCSCLPWKNIRTFKAGQESPKQSEGMSSAPIQDNANEIYTEELCYVLVDHTALRGRPSVSVNHSEGFYENISNKAGRQKESSRGTETEYSVLRFPSTPQPLPSSAEDEYELLVPSRFSSHGVQHPRPLTAPYETHFSHLQ
ncbi:germinal center-associated signaling and motility protein isoform X2 [Arvicanthis niloticus]|uniref:germinal center-associated signaling and motility protein isoform X2 n=1 Tax=Arvicanthis niloticus TaxID=61156 RepID=UPI00148651D3|nr:germinal center-associated signaling and motility protein isoform X2 [Arvicanthis niloticus]